MADLAEQELRSGVVRGVLRLGSLESAAGARLPPVLSAFHAQYPDVSIELQTGTTRALLRLLERFEVEAAFVSEPFEKGSLSSLPAFDEELVLITAKGAPALRRPADLGGQTLVAFPAWLLVPPAPGRVAGRGRRLARTDTGLGLVPRHRGLRGSRHRRGHRAGRSA